VRKSPKSSAVRQQRTSRSKISAIANLSPRSGRSPRQSGRVPRRIRLNPNLPGVYTLKGIIADYQDNLAVAVPAFQKAIVANLDDFQRTCTQVRFSTSSGRSSKRGSIWIARLRFNLIHSLPGTSLRALKSSRVDGKRPPGILKPRSMPRARLAPATHRTRGSLLPATPLGRRRQGKTDRGTHLSEQQRQNKPKLRSFPRCFLQLDHLVSWNILQRLNDPRGPTNFN
jgi:hypothetical protein